MGKGQNQSTQEIICAAVTGTLKRPTALIADLYAANGRLTIAGRSTELTATQSRQLAAVLTAAGQDHPWPDLIGAGMFGFRRTIAIVKTEPVVVEISADVAVNSVVSRHFSHLADRSAGFESDEGFLG